MHVLCVRGKIPVFMPLYAGFLPGGNLCLFGHPQPPSQTTLPGYCFMFGQMGHGVSRPRYRRVGDMDNHWTGTSVDIPRGCSIGYAKTTLAPCRSIVLDFIRSLPTLLHSKYN